MENNKAIFDIKTGETEIVEMSAEEIAQLEASRAEDEAERQAKAERQNKLESAKAKLAALGLDEAEVNAILGL